MTESFRLKDTIGIVDLLGNEVLYSQGIAPEGPEVILSAFKKATFYLCLLKEAVHSLSEE